MQITKQSQAGRYSRKRNINRNAVKKESPLQKDAEDYLKLIGVRYIRISDNLWRYIMATAPIQLKKELSKDLKGLPDLLILFKSGKYLAVELKSKTGKQTQGQIDFQREVGHENYRVINNFDDFKHIVDVYQRDTA